MTSFDAYVFREFDGFKEPSRFKACKIRIDDTFTDLSDYVVILVDRGITLDQLHNSNIEGTIALLSKEEACRAWDNVLIVGDDVTDDALTELASRGALFGADLRRSSSSCSVRCLYPRDKFVFRELPARGAGDSAPCWVFAGKLNHDQLRTIVMSKAEIAVRRFIEQILLTTKRSIGIGRPRNSFMGYASRRPEIAVPMAAIATCGAVPEEVLKLIEETMSPGGWEEIQIGYGISTALPRGYAWGKNGTWRDDAAAAGFPDFERCFYVALKCWQAAFPPEQGRQNVSLRIEAWEDNTEAFEKLERAAYGAGVDIMIKNVLENGVPLEHVVSDTRFLPTF